MIGLERVSLVVIGWMFSLLSWAGTSPIHTCDVLGEDNIQTLGAPLSWNADNGRLRLTEASSYQNEGFVFTKQVTTTSDIELHFRLHAFGGQWGTNTERYGDGFAVVFSDGGVDPELGGRGGSLGYSQVVLPFKGIYESGFAGGYLGIGIDEYGMYSQGSEGRSGGVGVRSNAVSVRGRGQGLFGYQYLTGSASLTPALGNNEAGQNWKVTLSANGLLNVWRDTGNGLLPIIVDYDVPADNGPLPDKVNISLLASNGGATNIHEVSNFVILSKECQAEMPQLVASNMTVDSASEMAAVSVALSRQITSGELKLRYSTRSGTALADSDFVTSSGVLVFDSTKQTHTLNIDLLSPAAGSQFFVDFSDYQWNGAAYSEFAKTVSVSVTSNDRDGDGVPNDLDTNPDNAASDSDQDGIQDIHETQNGSDPLDNCSPMVSLGVCDLDRDGIVNAVDQDDDGDGVSDVDETAQGSDPHDDADGGVARDSDGDGISDLREMALGTDASRADTDGDGIPDGKELTNKGLAMDTDGDGLINALDRDDDGDGVATADEDLNVDADNDPSTHANDLDGDGIPSYLDAEESANDMGGDSDGDGISDVIEKGDDEQPVDSDSDGIPDYLDIDSDNDGIDDGLENPNGDRLIDTDGDGVPNYIDTDSDNDGVSDAQESVKDSDGNGVADYLDDQIQSGHESQPVKTSVSGVGSLSWSVWALMALLCVRRMGWLLALLSWSFSTQALDWKKEWFEPSWHDGMDVYLGGGMGMSQLNPHTDQSGYEIRENQDRSLKLLAGWDFNEYFTMEGYVSDMGRVQLTTPNQQQGELTYKAAGVHAFVHHYFKGERYRSGSIGVFAKVGASKIFNTTSNVSYEQSTPMQMTTGIGLEYMINQDWSTRLEWDAYDQDASILSLTFVKRFGLSSTKVNRALAAINLLPATAVGRHTDTDEDGLADAFDDCPATHKGFEINDQGCAFYQDGLSSIQFQSNSARMTIAAKGRLLELADKLLENPTLHLRIVAHTDDQGSAVYNLKLSEERARVVRRYLIDLGIPAQTLTVKGMGESAPIASNKSARGRSKNRRVEFLVR